MRQPSKTKPRDATATMTALVMFCASEGGPCYRDWPEITLWNYLNFHANQHTLAWVQAHGRVCGCAVAWQCEEGELWGLEKRHAFTWLPTNPDGDSLFIADVVATRPGALEPMLRFMLQRWPEWERLKVFTMRRGKLHRFDPATLRRLAGVRAENVELTTLN